MPACPYHDSSCGHRGSTNHGNPGQPPCSHFKRHQPRCTMYLLTLDSSLFSASLNVMTLGLLSPSTPSFLVSPSPFSTVRKKASPIPIPPSSAKLYLPPNSIAETSRNKASSQTCSPLSTCIPSRDLDPSLCSSAQISVGNFPSQKQSPDPDQRRARVTRRPLLRKQEEQEEEHQAS